MSCETFSQKISRPLASIDFANFKLFFLHLFILDSYVSQSLLFEPVQVSLFWNRVFPIHLNLAVLVCETCDNTANSLYIFFCFYASQNYKIVNGRLASTNVQIGAKNHLKIVVKNCWSYVVKLEVKFRLGFVAKLVSC